MFLNDSNGQKEVSLHSPYNVEPCKPDYNKMILQLNNKVEAYQSHIDMLTIGPEVNVYEISKEVKTVIGHIYIEKLRTEESIKELQRYIAKEQDSKPL